MISRKRLLAVVSILIVVAFLNTGTFAILSDVENINGNEVRAYTPALKTYTTEEDFYNHTLQYNVVTKKSPGNVMLAGEEVADSSMYALAGGGTKKFYRYYILDDTWVNRPDAPGDIGPGGSMAYDESNYIYAMGGNNTNSFWRYDLTAHAWEVRNSTPAPVGAGGFLRHDDAGFFYALRGGGTGEMWKYDPSTEVWSTLTTSFPAMNDGASMIIYNNYIYIIRPTTGTTDPNDRAFIRANLDGTGLTNLATNNPFGTVIGPGASLTHGQGLKLLATKGNGDRGLFEYNIATNRWARLGNVPNSPKGGLRTGSDLSYDNTHPFLTYGGDRQAMVMFDSNTLGFITKANVPVPVGAGGNLLYVSFTGGGYSSYGHLESRVFDTGLLGAVYDSLFTDHTAPTGTSIIFKVRANDSRFWIPAPNDPNNYTGGNGTWDLSGEWTTVTGNDISFIVGQYVQWRVEMTSTGSVTPVLSEIRLYYRGF